MSDDSRDDDDSFTCSEYDYNDISGGPPKANSSGLISKAEQSNAMIFSKLMNLDSEKTNGRRTDENNYYKDDENGSCSSLTRNSALSVTSWEDLLSWSPDYESFAGVFCDIAELPQKYLYG